MKQCCASYDASHSHDLEQVHEEEQNKEDDDGAGDVISFEEANFDLHYQSQTMTPTKSTSYVPATPR